MVTLIESVITSLFFAILAVYKYNIAFRLKRRMGIPQVNSLKPFDCLPCFSFWISIPISAGFYLHSFGPCLNVDGIIETVISPMATFVAAYTIDK